ncbi:porin family protein [Mesorhizobium sp. M7A.F.Ca.US.011.01.1.1]|uniref:outer membrane protein n=1 Tax=Mesorhizobium sp. M7A.F.Ca.US.011.01.1.1 TaxID=2496741 RepID=UPI000FCA0607|nr:outer membrane protein [Mesorhizobium sp. M7A.F.Ca.US.011.01.1.1]RUX26608.1 porin family protein [Mesorhizobium sp. M7A.F.Ca.US.011.01.1.1]
MKKILLATTCFLGLASAASAADVVVEQGAAAYNWSGVYVGGNIGWSQLKSDWHDIDDDWGGGSYDAGSDGVLLGGVVGYNHQFTNNVVLGFEADLAYTSNSKSFDAPDSGRVDLTNKMNLFGTVRGRLGYAFDRFLPYVTGGLAVANFKHQWTETADPTDSWPDFGGAEAGWTAGAGIEYALTDHWTAKAEYLYADFGDVTSTNEDGYRMTVDRSVNTVRFGVNYKF